MSLAATESPFPIPRGLALALAAIGPVAIGAILAAKRRRRHADRRGARDRVRRARRDEPGALHRDRRDRRRPAARPRSSARSVIALGAFGIALAGLVLPAAFLSLSSVATPTTTSSCRRCALGGAGAARGARRLALELARPRSLAASVVFVVWSLATLGIAGRLWWDLAAEVLS